MNSVCKRSLDKRLFFKARLLSSLVDFLLIAALIKGIILLSDPILSLVTDWVWTNATFVFAGFFPIFYYSLFEKSRFRATPGKILVGLQVHSPSGKELSLWRTVGWTLLGYSIFWIVFFTSLALCGLAIVSLNLMGFIDLPANISICGYALGTVLTWVGVNFPIAGENRTILDVASARLMLLRTQARTMNEKHIILWSICAGSTVTLVRSYFGECSTSMFFGTWVISSSISYALFSLRNRNSQHFFECEKASAKINTEDRQA